jgi:hypothetical protein
MKKADKKIQMGYNFVLLAGEFFCLLSPWHIFNIINRWQPLKPEARSLLQVGFFRVIRLR